jgi:hypothetical protein
MSLYKTGHRLEDNINVEPTEIICELVDWLALENAIMRLWVT